MTIYIYSNNYNEMTGLGKQTLSITHQLKGKKRSFKSYKRLTKLIKNRSFFNFFYFVICQLDFFFLKDKAIGMSIVSPININAVHYSSCHLYSMRRVYGMLLLRLILRPVNIFYILLEYIHYKNPRTTNIFLSQVEKENFESVYGKTSSKNYIIRPKLTDRFFSDNISTKETDNMMIISHNINLKGGDVFRSIIRNNKNSKINVFGSSGGINDKNTVQHGYIDVAQFDYSNITYFVYPSKIDSHSFALEEALMHGLIPFYSKVVGFGEFLNRSELVHHYLCIDGFDELIWNEKIIAIKSNHSLKEQLINELRLLKLEWENYDIRARYTKLGVL